MPLIQRKIRQHTRKSTCGRKHGPEHSVLTQYHSSGQRSVNIFHSHRNLTLCLFCLVLISNHCFTSDKCQAFPFIIHSQTQMNCYFRLGPWVLFLGRLLCLGGLLSYYRSYISLRIRQSYTSFTLQNVHSHTKASA